MSLPFESKEELESFFNESESVIKKAIDEKIQIMKEDNFNAINEIDILQKELKQSYAEITDLKKLQALTVKLETEKEFKELNEFIVSHAKESERNTSELQKKLNEYENLKEIFKNKLQ